MKRLLIGFVVLTALIVGGIAAFLTTIDVNQYRDRIAEELSVRTGRKISLDGPLALGLSWDGLTLTVLNVSIGNPPWASRPVMADVGRFDLGVSLLPLLDHRIVITNLGISNCDIDLEAEDGNRDNWDFTPARGEKAQEERAGNSVAVHIGKFSIADSRITFYDRDGNAHSFTVNSMTVDGADGAHLRLDANYNGTPVSLDLKTGAGDLLPPHGSWPFSAALNYNGYNLNAEGQADIDAKNASISSYELTRGDSSIEGELTADWAKEVPVVRGKLTGGSVTLSDFMGDVNAKSGTPSSGDRAGPKHLFDDRPLVLDGLKTVDGAFDISIGELVLPDDSFKNLTAVAKLDDGVLSVERFRALLGSGTLEGKAVLSDATSPPQFAIQLAISKANIDDILHLFSTPGLVSGRANIEINLAGTGNSTRAMAANAVGIMNFTATGGNVSGSMLYDISSVLMTMFAPGGSNDMQCIAARFIVKNGIARDNGILIDTTSTTIAGNGTLDFPHEAINLVLHAKTKHVNVGSLLPAAYVGGTFLAPRFSVNPSEVFGNVGDIIAYGGASYTVPDILTHPGDNACLYTLDNPAPDDAVPPGVPDTTMAGKALNTLTGIGDVLHGLFGQ